jgi:riboflavin kinase / FMN adenylyltransferase
MHITSKIPTFKTPTAITVGNFDGLHIGHMQLVNELVRTAKQQKLTSVIITFNPHPIEFFNPNIKVLRISDIPEMKQILANVNIHHLIQLPFTDEISKMSPKTFWNEVLIKNFQPHFVVVGEDHLFGKNREGTPDVLREFGKNSNVQIIVKPQKIIKGDVVSSTRIRRLIEKGHLESARTLLGHDLYYIGEVIRGEGRGRKLGFPTANLALPGRVLPPAGVYVSKTKVDSSWLPSISYIGNSPTFAGRTLWLETHILGFDESIYNRTINVNLIKRLREEIRFADAEQLIAQMNQDVKNAVVELSGYETGNGRKTL